MNRCDVCGKFRYYGFLDSEMITPDSDYSYETWSTVCSVCAPEKFEKAQNRCSKCNALERFENLVWKEDLFGGELIDRPECEACNASI